MYIIKKVHWQLGFRDSLLLYKSGILTFLDQGDIDANKEHLQGLQTLLKLTKDVNFCIQLKEENCCSSNSPILPNMRLNTIQMLKENQVRCTKYEKTFLNVSTHLWNRLPQELKTIVNTQSFKLNAS